MCRQNDKWEATAGDLTPLTIESAGLMPPEELNRINRYIAAELLAWAAMLDQTLSVMYRHLADDLRSRAFWLSPPNPDDLTEIETRLAELRGNR